MEQTQINVNTETDLVEVFVQRNKNYYKNKFEKMKKSGKSISWNWAAFFMGIYWMIYRKMYFKAAAFLLLNIIATNTPHIGVYLNTAVLVGIGIFGNALYLDHVEEKIEKAKIIFPHNKEEVLAKRGGTNLPLVVGLSVAHVATLSIVFALMM